MRLAHVMLLALPGVAAAQTPERELAQQVIAAESSFAASMAKRDINAFAALVAPDAVFFGTSESFRGKQAVVEGWRPLFKAPTAPFSWKPESVDVLPSGALAWSSGPVHDASGRQIGTFNSVWRRGANGKWLVILDKGCPVCACGPSDTTGSTRPAP
jgi:ketosteroid isomerase-like protein